MEENIMGCCKRNASTMLGQYRRTMGLTAGDVDSDWIEVNLFSNPTQCNAFLFQMNNLYH
jgi:hypothetical protein